MGDLLRDDRVTRDAGRQDDGARFGAPLDERAPEDLATPDTVFQVGVDPVRLDILSRLDGVTFDEAWADHPATRLGGVPGDVLSRTPMLRNKRAAGRAQALADVERLERGDDD